MPSPLSASGSFGPIAVATAALAIAQVAAADPVEALSAGRLRVVVTDLAREVEDAYGVELTPSDGGSGLMRERIEHGERPDLCLSADPDSARDLEAQCRPHAPVVAFAGMPARPEAARVAFDLRSDCGQPLIANAGLVSIAGAGAP